MVKRRTTAHHHSTIQLQNMASQYGTNLHIAQFHRVQMSTDHTDDTDGSRWSKMNSGMTDITSTHAHEQEHPQNTPNS